MNNSITDSQLSPFFNRGPGLLARLTFFLILSIVVMVVDARLNYLDYVRQTGSALIYPLQRIVNFPVIVYRNVAGFFILQSNLQSENLVLKHQKLANSSQLLRYKALVAENDYLRKLLQARTLVPQQTIVAELLSLGHDPFSHKILVDKGSVHGVKAGQAAIDAAGVIGQITRVYPLSSEITLLTDKNMAMPVEVLRNGLRAIVFGSGREGVLDLPFMPLNAELEPGDQLLTSGIDGTHPRGLPVAVIHSVERNPAYAFAKITCIPSAGVGSHTQLLLLSGEMKNEPPATPPLTNKPAETGVTENNTVASGAPEKISAGTAPVTASAVERTR